MNPSVFLQMGWMRGWMQDLLVFLGAFFVIFIWAGDFNPMQSQEAAAAVWKLRCGGGEVIGAQGGMLHVVASTFGFHSLPAATALLQVWCFASAAAFFWVAFRLMKDNGFEGLGLVFVPILMFFSLRSLLQWADFGHASLLDFALFALALHVYLQGRIQVFWVVFAVLLVQSALALPLIAAVLVHLAAGPGFLRNAGGFLYSFPIFGGIPLALLMAWEHLVTGDSDVLPWAIMRDPLLSAGPDWNDLLLWADPELLVPFAGLLTLLLLATFNRRWRVLRSARFSLPVTVAATVVLMAAWGWVDSGRMLMMLKWMAWVLFIFFAGVMAEGWIWGAGAAAMAFVCGFFLPFGGAALSHGERTAVKSRAAEEVAFSAAVFQDGGEGDAWVSMAGLPASQAGCDCRLLGPGSPADEVLSTVRIFKPVGAVLPGYDVFRDSMEAFGYERRADFWAPVLEGDMPWVHWQKRKAGFVCSRQVADSVVQGQDLVHVPGLSLNRYLGSRSLRISIPDSSVQALRFGLFSTLTFWESAEIRVVVGDSASHVLPMRAFAGKEETEGKILTLTIDLPGSIREGRSMTLDNPLGGAFLLINPETISPARQ